MEQKSVSPTTASTEEKIKEAARKVFTKKGYAATRTRDIAEECGFNVALINYYFRSKERLFDIIMVEQLQMFVSSISGLLDNHETTLHEKIELLISHYIDMLIANPGLPVFILNEINSNPEKFVSKLQLPPSVENFHILKQLNERVLAGKMPNINPLQLFLNLVSMTVFPFIAAPLIKAKSEMKTEDFNELMIARKKLIPIWMKAILETNPE